MQSLECQYKTLVPGRFTRSTAGTTTSYSTNSNILKQFVPSGLFMRSTTGTTTSSAGESRGPSLKIGIGSMPGTTAGGC